MDERIAYGGRGVESLAQERVAGAEIFCAVCREGCFKFDRKAAVTGIGI